MPLAPNRVWWWSLDRNGNPLDPSTLNVRRPSTPPLKDDSPYTPGFMVDGQLPPTHLHHKDGCIVGIHGESDLTHLRVTLLLCLRDEQRIIHELARTHTPDIMLSDVFILLSHRP